VTLFEYNPIWYVGGHWSFPEVILGLIEFDLRFDFTVALCESLRVQRDLQFEEQVGQGPCCVRGIRHGSVFSVLHQIRRCEAPPGRAQPDVLPIVDSQDARSDTGTG
jgi:hypothetical protein